MATLMASRESRGVVTTTTTTPETRWKAVRAMSQPGEARTVADPTDYPPEVWVGLLDHYRETAVQILGVHQCSGTECSSCGQHWPCRAACAAEIALEL
jgi:hypothetical protein